MCGGKDCFVYRSTNVGVVIYFCRQCGPGDGFDLLQKLNGWDLKRAAEEIDRISGEYLRDKPKAHKRQVMSVEDVSQIWGDAKPIMLGDPVDTYLRSA